MDEIRSLLTTKRYRIKKIIRNETEKNKIQKMFAKQNI